MNGNKRKPIVVNEQNKCLVWGYIRNEYQHNFPNAIKLLCAHFSEYTLDSAILNNMEENRSFFVALCEQLKKNSVDVNPKLIYRASVDGFRSSDFHSKCDEKGPTICVIQTRDDYMFGGYTAVSWKKYSIPHIYSHKDDTAFLFAIRPILEFYEVCEGKEDEAVYHSYDGLMAFGNTQLAVFDKCDEWVSDYRPNGGTFKTNGAMIAGPKVYGSLESNYVYEFLVKELEVFTVG